MSEITKDGPDEEGDDTTGEPIIGLPEAEMAERERIQQCKAVAARTTETRLEQLETNAKAKAALAAAGFAAMPPAKSALDLAIPTKPFRFLWGGQVYTGFKDKNRLPLPLSKTATR
jgi:hypothetical protein